MSSLSKAPFMGSVAETMIRQTQYGPLLGALKEAGMNTERIARQLVAKANSFMQDPINTAVDFIIQEKDQVIIAIQNMAKNPRLTARLSAAIATCFSNSQSTQLEATISGTLNSLANNPTQLQRLLSNASELRSWLHSQFTIAPTTLATSNAFQVPQRIPQQALMPNLSTLAASNSYMQTQPIMPLAPTAITTGTWQRNSNYVPEAQQSAMNSRPTNCCRCCCS